MEMEKGLRNLRNPVVIRGGHSEEKAAEKAE